MSPLDVSVPRLNPAHSPLLLRSHLQLNLRLHQRLHLLLPLLLLPPLLSLLTLMACWPASVRPTPQCLTGRGLCGTTNSSKGAATGGMMAFALQCPLMSSCARTSSLSNMTNPIVVILVLT